MVVQKLDHSELLQFFSPKVSRHVDHSSQQLQKKISVLFAVLRQFNIAVHILLKGIQRDGVELRDVATDFEEECVSVLEGSEYQLLMLVILRHYFGVPRIRC